MSSALEGWYVDPLTGTNLRFWSGSAWTDQVAPLPDEPARSRPIDLFASVETTAPAAEPDPPASEPSDESEPSAEPAAETAVEPGPEPAAAEERTPLTRRELRALREAGVEPDDAPRQQQPTPAAAPITERSEPVEAPEAPAQPTDVPAGDETPDQPQGRHRRAVRMSVLLGILAVVSSVGVLTAGTL